MLEHIIPSKARRKILELFFHHPNESYYLRRIVREVDEEVNAVKRELDILSDEKLLLKERRLNKVFYTLNKNYIFYDDFLRIFAKKNLLASLVYKNISKMGKIKFVVFSTKFLKQAQIKEDEIYFLMVGIVVVPEVAGAIAEAEKQFGREINYTVMTEEEFNYRKSHKDPFIVKVLLQPRITLIGDEIQLLS